MTTPDTNRLTELLQQKHQVLVQLQALAKRLLDATTGGDTAAMISLIAAKQGLIDALMSVEKQLAPFREQSPEERVWESPEHRANAAEISQQCNLLLEDIMQLDRQGIEQAQSRQAKTKLQIDSAHHAASARNAYLSNDAAVAPRIDVASQG